MNIFTETNGSDKASEEEVAAVNLKFDGDMLFIELSDGRQIGLPFRKIKWLNWLANATVAQRAKWAIEPYGYAIWWDELDDGIEVVHALSPKSLPSHQSIQKPVAKYA